MNGMCGMLSVLYCLDHLQSNTSLRIALALPFLGLFFDIFDGRVARWSGSTSMLGQQLDSLADLVSLHLIRYLLVLRLLAWDMRLVVQQWSINLS
jgi:CDP-diacylglycerol---serine O-phosphatidyltransferase